jgi:hypothetical protein
MHIDTITPQRILDHITYMKKDSAIPHWIEFHLNEIEFLSRYLIEDAFNDAVEERDLVILTTISRFNPGFQLQASIAITKILFSEIKP